MTKLTSCAEKNSVNRTGGAIVAAASLALLASSETAKAHPHVWVTYETTVNYADGAVVGVTNVWAFDDMYTAMAVQGLDKNGDGAYTREELSELAKINMEGLKDFSYFTFPKLANSELKFKPPEDAWLEYTNGILKLHFSLALEKPVLAEAEGLSFSIYDPSFFIAFEPEQTQAVKVSSAPAGCFAALVDPASDQAAEDAKRLGDAMAQNLGGDMAAGMGSFGAAKSVSVTCKKS